MEQQYYIQNCQLNYKKSRTKEYQIFFNFIQKTPHPLTEICLLYTGYQITQTTFQIRLISASRKCYTTKIYVLLTCALTTIKQRVIKLCIKVYEHSGVNHFLRVKTSLEEPDKRLSLDCKFDSIDMLLSHML